MNIQTKRDEKHYFQTPKYNIFRKNNVYEIIVYMPSVTKDSVQVSLHNGQLTIEGKRSFKPQDGWRLIRQELSQDDYKLQLQLNMDIDPDSIGAKVQDGVLVLKLPVVQSAQSRTIAIN